MEDRARREKVSGSLTGGFRGVKSVVLVHQFSLSTNVSSTNVVGILVLDMSLARCLEA